MPLPNTSPDMSPTPTTVKSLDLDVGAQFAEVALHRFPGAAGGDAHLLMVVADAAAAGESVAQPEAALQRDAVGDIGKGGGALVGRHHQIGIVAIRAQHVRRRHDLAVLVQIVGDVQQGVDENLIGGDAGFHELFAAGIWRHQLGKEAALGAHRHDHRILDLLRLDQAQYFGAEILAPVATSASRRARCGRSADARLPRPGNRRKSPARAGAPAARPAWRSRISSPWRARAIPSAVLEEVGAQHRVDHILEAADDAVVVQRGHIAQRRGDASCRSLPPLWRARRKDPDRAGRETAPPARRATSGLRTSACCI